MPINKQFTPEGFSSLSKGKRITNYSSTRLAEAKASGEVLEATVTLCDSEHNLFVDLGCVKGIIPRKEGAIGIAEGKTRDIALISKVGKPVSFVVEELTYDSDGKLTAYLSRTKAQKKFLQYFSENYANGDVITAKITHLEKFGAFCDIGCGVIALLPIDAISVSRIAHPSDRFSVGEDIKVIIKSVDNDGKITLSHKELLGTWEENAALFSEGMTVSGVVRSKESYGIFVELAPNLAGLAEPKDGVLPGMTAGVFIKSIIPEKMKIKLIIIDSFPGQVQRGSKYFYEEKHIDLWQYSPENCPKKIYTDFLHQKDI